MNTYIVEPLVGVAPIRLGMMRDGSRSIMGIPHISFRKSSFSKNDTDAYLENCFQVFFDDRNCVEYIELSSGGPFEAIYDNIDIFGTKADELVEQLSQKASYNKEDPELGYSYVFPTLELALWSPVLPESNEDSEGRYFMIIGIGVLGYFSK